MRPEAHSPPGPTSAKGPRRKTPAHHVGAASIGQSTENQVLQSVPVDVATRRGPVAQAGQLSVSADIQGHGAPAEIQRRGIIHGGWDQQDSAGERFTLWLIGIGDGDQDYGGLIIVRRGTKRHIRQGGVDPGG